MVSKVVILLSVVAYTQSALIGAPAISYGHPYGAHYGYPGYGVAPAIAKVAVAPKVEDYDPNPQYSFSYDVQDALTGDSKAQHETRSGDVVQGSYTLVEPDGSRRTVEYTADPVNGFNAVVHKQPLGVAVAKAVVPAVAKAVLPGPAYRPYGYHGYPVAAPLAVAHAPVGIAHAPIAHARYPYFG